MTKAIAENILPGDLAARRYLTSEQAAAYLATSVAALATLRWRDAGPAYRRVGRSIRYSVADLDAYMEGASA